MYLITSGSLYNSNKGSRSVNSWCLKMSLGVSKIIKTYSVMVDWGEAVNKYALHALAGERFFYTWDQFSAYGFLDERGDLGLFSSGQPF